MECPYCLTEFDLDSKLPVILPCNHTICQECSLFIKAKAYICPLDNLIIEVNPQNFSTEKKKILESFCPIHKNKRKQGICLKHFELICEACSESHQKCELFMGTEDAITKKLTEIYTGVCDKGAEIKRLLSESDKTLLNDLEKYLKDTFNESDDESQEMPEVQIDDVKQHVPPQQELAPEVPVREKLVLANNRQTPDNSIPTVSDEVPKKSIPAVSEEEAIESLDPISKEIVKAFNALQNRGVKFLLGHSINKEPYKTYEFYITQNFCEVLRITKLAFGRPSIPENSIYISSFTLEITEPQDKAKFVITDTVFISYSDTSIIEEVNLKEEIELVKDSSLSVMIIIEGESNYVFCPPICGGIAIFDDKYQTIKEIPILYGLSD